jgi:serine/threonine protein kinase
MDHALQLVPPCHSNHISILIDDIPWEENKEYPPNQINIVVAVEKRSNSKYAGFPKIKSMPMQLEGKGTDFAGHFSFNRSTRKALFRPAGVLAPRSIYTMKIFCVCGPMCCGNAHSFSFVTEGYEQLHRPPPNKTKNNRRELPNNQQPRTTTKKLRQEDQTIHNLPRISQRIHRDDFEYQTLISEGTFGKVYNGRWKPNNIDVAVKFLPNPKTQAESDAFEREITILQNEHHPRIVLLLAICDTLYDREEGYKALLMEVMDLGSLYILLHSLPSLTITQVETVFCTSKTMAAGSFAFLDDSDNSTTPSCSSSNSSICSRTSSSASSTSSSSSGFTFSLRHCIQIALDIAEGMRFLHDRNIAHRDLKSGNVLIDREKRAKIADFGLSAYYAEGWTHMLNIGGTCGWSAPEVLDTKYFCNESDVYSFGVILWELLTEDIPWEGMSENDVKHLVVTERQNLPMPPEQNRFPKTFETLITHCMAYCDNCRPSFAEIFDELQLLEAEI